MYRVEAKRIPSRCTLRVVAAVSRSKSRSSGWAGIRGMKLSLRQRLCGAEPVAECGLSLYSSTMVSHGRAGCCRSLRIVTSSRVWSICHCSFEADVVRR